MIRTHAGAGFATATWVTASWLLLVAPARADVAPKWTDAQLTAFSDVIVTGQVARVAAAVDDRLGAIYSYVTLDVERVIKGKIGERRITIKQLGGQVGATALDIAGQATFSPGEHVLVFLEVRPRDGTLATTALWQGKFSVVRDAGGTAARRNDPRAGGATLFTADTRPFDAWLQALDRLVADGDPVGSVGAIELAPQGAAQAVSTGGSAPQIGPSWRSAANRAIRLDATRPGQTGFADGGEALIRSAADFWSRTGLIQLAAGGLQSAGCLIGPADAGRIVVGVDSCGELGARSGTLAVSGGWIRYDNSGIAAGPAYVSAFVMTNVAAPATRLLTKPSCFEAVMTHELGHAIGLGHSSDELAPMNAFLRCDAGFGTIVSPAQTSRTRAAGAAAVFGGVTMRPTMTARPGAEVVTVTALQRVSVAGDGTQGNGASSGPSLSGDGRCIAFHSGANNLSPSDTNGFFDIFVFDRISGLTTRESVGVSGAEANGHSVAPALGPTCRYVAFVSEASNLVSGVSGSQVYVRDRELATTVVASVSGAGTPGNAAPGTTSQLSVSRDGRLVSFRSEANNLVANDTNGVADVFTRDVTGGTTTRDNTATDGTQAAVGHSGMPSLSGDGRYVAFDSEANNLVVADSSGREVFVKDRLTGQTTLESVGSSGEKILADSPSLSADARFLAFTSNNTRLFYRDRAAGQTFGILSVPVTTFLGPPELSADGRLIAYQHGSVVEVYDRVDGRFSSIAAGGEPTSVNSGVLAFTSASALVSGDTNSATDVYIAGISTTGASPTAPTAPTNLTFSLAGSTLTISWTAPAGATPTSYIIEAGSVPGGVDIANFSTGSPATSFSAAVGGSGTLYIRVRASGASGTSAASNEITVILGPSGASPGVPSALTASVSGNSVTLTWAAPVSGGAVTSYFIEAGSSSGASDLAAFDTGTSATSFSAAGVGPGTYFVRVRASNAAGRSAPSNEVVLVVGSSCSALGAPSGLAAAVAGSNVTLTWTAGANASSYLLLVGSNPGQNDILVTDLQSSATSLSATGVGAGSYFVRLRSLSPCGQSGDSNEVLVIVR